MNANDLKLIVRAKYGEIAQQSKLQNSTSCCGGTSCCSEVDYTIFSDDYTQLAGYNPDADLGLGCGLPTELADIGAGHAVLDLGSGAGNDCFVARTLTGPTGQVTGLDFTDEMIQKARTNHAKTGFTNIEFVKGDIEEMPLPDKWFDVVISNCVLNLVPNKQKAFAEIYRVLKPGGHFCISDVVLKGELPAPLVSAAELYVGCVAGAIQSDEYIDIIRQQGFQQIEIKREKAIVLPDEILLQFLTDDELKAYRRSNTGISSITVYASK